MIGTKVLIVSIFCCAVSLGFTATFLLLCYCRFVSDQPVFQKLETSFQAAMGKKASVV